MQCQSTRSGNPPPAPAAVVAVAAVTWLAVGAMGAMTVGRYGWPLLVNPVLSFAEENGARVMVYAAVPATLLVGAAVFETWAAAKGHADLVKLLLSKGADAGMKMRRGFTARQIAAHAARSHPPAGADFAAVLRSLEAATR